MSEQLPFRIKRSAVEGKRPQNADLELGELALNTSDGKAFMKKSDGNVIEIIPLSADVYN